MAHAGSRKTREVAFSLKSGVQLQMVMVLGGLLAPLRWLWYTCLFVCSHSWMLAATIALFSSAYLLYRHRSAAAGPSARHSAVSKTSSNRNSRLGKELLYAWVVSDIGVLLPEYYVTKVVLSFHCTNRIPLFFGREYPDNSVLTNLVNGFPF